MNRVKLIFGLLVMAIGAFVLWQMNDLRSKAEAAPSWPSVIGSITTSELDFEKDARIRYRYAVGGEEFESSRLFFGVISNGDILLEDGSTLSDASLVARFPMGAQIAVHYDPAEPSRAVLLPEAAHQTGMMTLIFGYGFLAIGLLFIASGIVGERRFGTVNIGEIVLRVLAGGVFVVVGLQIVSFVGDIRSEARMARSWPSVMGTVTLAEVWGDHPEVAYRYSVDGEDYLSDQISIGIASGRLTLEDGTAMMPRQLNRRFRTGEPVEVFVDPDDPANAVLLPDAKHNADVPIYFGYALAVLGPLILLFGKTGGGAGRKPAPQRGPLAEDSVVRIKRKRRRAVPES